MPAKKVLYVSGSLGLGHIVRDLAIAEELCRQNPDVRISWLTSPLARKLIEDSGGTLHPEIEAFADDNIPAENAAKPGYRLDLRDYVINAVGEWAQNVHAFRRAISSEPFDLVIADEAYEIAGALESGDLAMDIPFVMIYDFFGNAAMTWNPLERLRAYKGNRGWAKMPEMYTDPKRIALYIGEVDDIPDTRLGFLLPNRRHLAKKLFNFVGYVLPFDPADFQDRAALRRELGYGDESLVVCSVGGTAVGRDLLVLCADAYPIIAERIPDLKMVFVCGPRLPVDSIPLPAGAEIRGYVPSLYQHLAACDLAIVQGGGTTTLELTALRRPFLYFPIEGHFEQQFHVAGRLESHGAGVRMSYARTSASSLADRVVEHLGQEVTYPPIRTNGAKRSVELISQFL